MSKEHDNIIEDNSSNNNNALSIRSKKVSSSSGSNGSQHGRNMSSGQNFYTLNTSQQHPHHNSTSSMGSTKQAPSLFACPNSIGMSQYVSASALRHASPQFSFTKSDRFPAIKLSETTSSSSQNIVMPWTGSPKTCSFGFGSKNFFHQHVMRNARDYPSPDTYNLSERKLASPPHQSSQSPDNKTSPKCSFGISYHYYAKTYVPGYKMQCTEVAKEMPGVGQYRVEREPGENKLKFSLFGKPKDLLVSKDDQPASNHYKPIYSLEENQRYTKLTFGKGNKFDFAKNARNCIPGPGTYKLPSSFDKFDPQSQFRSQRNLRRTAFV